MPIARAIPIAAALCACLLTAALAGCGGDDEDLVEEDALRECLADAGLSIEPAQATAGAGLGNVSPDFRAVTADGVEVEAIVHGNAKKASRSAADIRAALESFGAASSDVVSDRNAVVVIGGEASEEERKAIEGCLAG